MNCNQGTLEYGRCLNIDFSLLRDPQGLEEALSNDGTLILIIKMADVNKCRYHHNDPKWPFRKIDGCCMAKGKREIYLAFNFVDKFCVRETFYELPANITMKSLELPIFRHERTINGDLKDGRHLDSLGFPPYILVF
jgi:hypothetical protein